MELLAPAGDFNAFTAAIEAGADAVYLGLGALNARHRAQNFTADQLISAVEIAHARQRRVYLTLNVDIAQRELGLAARALQLAARAGVDAVLVRDPALMRLRPQVPTIDFHFSTQTCMANHADVQAAASLGLSRVVLARELTLAEIAAASACGVETEVFAQGALCFSVSGRCLLSSWVGGRSGNRGMCTSPCRVPWTADGQPIGAPLSMRDLATIHRLADLRRAGVAAIKIEGRLKTAAWVGQAVALYRRGLSGLVDAPQCSSSGDVDVDVDGAGDRSGDGSGAEEATSGGALLSQAAMLGGYTGRELTCGYLDGQRAELTGMSTGRRSGVIFSAMPSREDKDELSGYSLELQVGEKAILCRCSFAGKIDEWTVSRSEVKRAHKAVNIQSLFARLAAIDQIKLDQAQSNNPACLLVPRAANGIAARVAAFIRRARQNRGEINEQITPSMRAVLQTLDPHPANQLHLGQRPDRVRLAAHKVEQFLAQARPRPRSGIIVEGLSRQSLERLLGQIDGGQLVVALPSVFFDADVEELRDLILAAKKASMRVEVNSWGGWWLAKQIGARMESGPGLPVLNSLAASQLGEMAIESVTLSPEADREQLEDLSAHCAVPCSMVVYGRPPLMISRVDLPAEMVAGRILEDRRQVRLVSQREGELWILRPRDAFDLRSTVNERIRVKHLVVDLVAAPNPVSEWQSSSSTSRLTFNYFRALA